MHTCSWLTHEKALAIGSLVVKWCQLFLRLVTMAHSHFIQQDKVDIHILSIMQGCADKSLFMLGKCTSMLLRWGHMFKFVSSLTNILAHCSLAGDMYKLDCLQLEKCTTTVRTKARGAAKFSLAL